ncbi:DNA-directed RNA polymerase III, subunit Rpc31 [Dioszegia hungarica]|uniref:DNA-directed RNA polymerase III, subunit Rpc31 n=1 Tax=Dioszegia hungarica TaxID=4972 RepID=A0AA38HBS9_9TREE|nr:DNA-directed RNA polymerase III, subunit Rpc31 [Dioszegia hungarica]KAI9636146.1 DNA-directed RNA polymerase III, subunit Rpc31 [Dioszegia hungarica]
MSRGGFRGRGGGGRGGMPSVPGMSHEAYREIMAAPPQHAGMLYPPLSSASVAFLPRPSDFESGMIRKETELEETLRKGIMVDQEQGTYWCGWRLPEVRKMVGIEIETYSDLFARPTAAAPNDEELDPVKMKMDEMFFPPSLWDAYFEPEKEQKRGKGKVPKKRKTLDSDGDDKPDGEEAEKSSNASSAEEDAEYEDESDHQDYDANYFDNGEGDDDEGGEDEDVGNGGNFDE